MSRNERNLLKATGILGISPNHPQINYLQADSTIDETVVFIGNGDGLYYINSK